MQNELLVISYQRTTQLEPELEVAGDFANRWTDLVVATEPP
jgi:hypothetical protein